LNAQDYAQEAAKRGLMPTWSGLLSEPAAAAFIPGGSVKPKDFNFFKMQASHGLVSSAFPTLSTPNVAAILANAPPKVTGITADRFLPTASKGGAMSFSASAAEEPMSEPALLRCDSVLAALCAAGVDVALVAPSDAAARLLSHQLAPYTTLSVADGKVETEAGAAAIGGDGMAADASTGTATVVSMQTLAALAASGSDSHAAALMCAAGGPVPTSSGAVDDTASASVTAAAYALNLAGGLALQRRLLRPSARSVSLVLTADGCFHDHAPPAAPALAALSAVDAALGRLHAAGCVVAVTATHGMNDKTGFNAGEPRVVYLDDHIQTAIAEAASMSEAASAAEAGNALASPFGAVCVVLCKSGDASAAVGGGRAGALGGCAMLHCADPAAFFPVVERLRAVNGVYSVVGRADAAHAFDLPADRIGDYVVVADVRTVLGRSSGSEAQTGAALVKRSHGSLEEAKVPMWVNRPLLRRYQDGLNKGKLRNYGVFDLLLNGVERHDT
jgi:phosphonoacetate hydrolase